MSLSTSALAFDSSGISYDTSPPPRRRDDDGGDTFARCFANYSTPPSTLPVPPPRPDGEPEAAFKQNRSDPLPPAVSNGTANPLDEEVGKKEEPEAKSSSGSDPLVHSTKNKNTSRKNADETDSRLDRRENLAQVTGLGDPGLMAPLSALKSVQMPGPIDGTSGSSTAGAPAPLALSIHPPVTASTITDNDAQCPGKVTPLGASAPDASSDGDVSSENILPVAPILVDPARAGNFSPAALTDATARMGNPSSEKNSALPVSLTKPSLKDKSRNAENFQTSDVKTVTKSSDAVGISGAKSPVEMPTLPKTHAGFTRDDSLGAMGSVASSSGQDEKLLGSEISPASAQQVAQRAVEAVMSVADLAATRQQHAVNLQFSVNGTPLEVRVEMKSGDVHTTFRTDSSDLRAALADAWQNTAVDRSATTRLVPPVFSAGSSSFLSSSAGGNQSQQQRQPQENFSAQVTAAPPSPSKSWRPSTPVTATARSEDISPLSTSYLHTFA